MSQIETTLAQPQSKAASTESSLPVFRPAYRGRKEADHVRIDVDMPGVRKDAVKITVEQRTLVLEGQRDDVASSDWRVRYRESQPGIYRIRFNLDADVDASQATAQAENGVVTVKLPYRAENQPRLIPVQ